MSGFERVNHTIFPDSSRKCCKLYVISCYREGKKIRENEGGIVWKKSKNTLLLYIVLLVSEMNISFRLNSMKKSRNLERLVKGKQSVLYISKLLGRMFCVSLLALHIFIWKLEYIVEFHLISSKEVPLSTNCK